MYQPKGWISFGGGAKISHTTGKQIIAILHSSQLFHIYKYKKLLPHSISFLI